MNHLFFFLVDGNWGQWSPYSVCSATCGERTKYKTRTCDTPSPANGGASCVGDATRTAACNAVACPGILVINTNIDC